jgi:hypothetical protein
MRNRGAHSRCGLERVLDGEIHWNGGLHGKRGFAPSHMPVHSKHLLMLHLQEALLSIYVKRVSLTRRPQPELGI